MLQNVKILEAHNWQKMEVDFWKTKHVPNPAFIPNPNPNPNPYPNPN